MSDLRVRLFSRFNVEVDGQSLEGLEARKVQELFSYLLIHRDRPHPRETLAGILWDAQSTAQSKKYLRQALWQLHNAFQGLDNVSVEPILIVEAIAILIALRKEILPSTCLAILLATMVASSSGLFTS